MRKGAIITLATILLSGCITDRALEQSPQETRTLTPEGVAVEYEESMESLKKTKEGESNQSNETFDGNLTKYNEESDSRYKAIIEAVKKEEERLRGYKREGQ